MPAWSVVYITDGTFDTRTLDDEKHRLSVKPEGLFGDIKTTNVFHHPVKAKI